MSPIIQKPFVVASLPRPINHATGKYVAADVKGGIPGSRKRKLSELAVGIDGEGVILYDTLSSKPITSYTLPPQSTFTCAPYSVRLRTARTKRFERRTYVSTQDNKSSITLFRDLPTTDGSTESATVTYHLENAAKPVIFMGGLPEQSPSKTDPLLLVREDGELKCLDGDDLKLRWTSPANVITRDAETSETLERRVKFAALTDAHTASKGILKGHPEVLSTFPEAIKIGGFNPSIIVLVTVPVDPSLSFRRVLHIAVLPQSSEIVNSQKRQFVQTLLTLPIPRSQEHEGDVLGNIIYDMHMSSGELYVLSGSLLEIYSLSESLPKYKSCMQVDNSGSFLRLNRTSFMTASNNSVDIYDYKFESHLASIVLGQENEITGEVMEAETDTFKLVTYSPKHGLIHAVSGNRLIAFQIEAGQEVSDKHRTVGYLLRSCGCEMKDSKNQWTARPNDSYTKSDVDWESLITELDHYVATQDIEKFEELFAQEVGLTIDEAKLAKSKKKRANGLISNGIHRNEDVKPTQKSNNSNAEVQPLSPWIWPEAGEDFPMFDQRLVHYALSRIFTLLDNDLSDSTGPATLHLGVAFFPHGVINWLLETGNLTKSNIERSLEYTEPRLPTEGFPTGQLVTTIIEVDPEMKMLLSLLSNCSLDAAELIYAIKVLMRSLGLFGENTAVERLLLKNGETIDAISGDENAEIEFEEEEADVALKLAEYRLLDEDGAGIRGQALSLALAKLHKEKARSIVRALQSTLTTSEISSLIYLLRIELGRGAWTSKYLDILQADDNDGEIEAQDGNIELIADLLNSCIDAIGTGGWLSGDAVLINGDHFESEELISGLKLEVSAALEGIEEAAYLKGLTSEMIRYGNSVQGAIPASERKRRIDSSTDTGRPSKSRPITLPSDSWDSSLLPFGLKAEQQISRMKLGAGGEVYRRTARDIGMLKSKKVGKYSRERIVI